MKRSWENKWISYLEGGIISEKVSLTPPRTFDQLTIWTWNWHTQLSWPWTKLCWATKWTNWDILYYFLSTISHFFCKYYTSMQVSYFVLQSHENWSITNEKQSTITSLWLNQCVNTTYILTYYKLSNTCSNKNIFIWDSCNQDDILN